MHSSPDARFKLLEESLSTMIYAVLDTLGKKDRYFGDYYSRQLIVARRKFNMKYKSSYDHTIANDTADIQSVCRHS